MNYTVLGANGQLGKEWVKYLIKKNLNVTSYDSSEADLTNFEVVREKLRESAPDILINCAAYTKVDLAEDASELAFAVNAEAVKKLATFCSENAIKLVHYSTDYVFSGEEKAAHEFPNGYTEDANVQPINVYGASKLKGEQAIQESGCDALIYRVSWLCGAHGNNFVKTMLRLAKTRDEISVVNDQLGAPTYAKEVVRLSEKALELQATGLYHLSSSGIISWYDFAVEIFKFSGIDIKCKPVPSSAYPTKAKRPAFSKLNPAKLSDLLKEEIIDWKDGLHELLKEIRLDGDN